VKALHSRFRVCRAALSIAVAVALASCSQVDRPIVHGEFEGVLVRMAGQGIVSRTWEGEMVHIGRPDGGPDRLRFTVRNDVFGRQLALIAERKMEIRIRYRKEPYWLLDSSSDGVFLTDFERLSDLRRYDD
jgi:hypothetical protein